MKTTTAQNQVKRNLLLAAIACVLFFPLTAGAIPIDSTVILEDNTDDGTYAKMQLTITGEGTTTVNISAQVLEPNNADIEAILFNFAGDFTVLSVVGGDVTDWDFISPVDELDNNVVFGDFDGGVKIGITGGTDPIYATSFAINADRNIFFADLFGARLQSVGVDSTLGSSKLTGTRGPNQVPELATAHQVPEPASALLLGLGLIGVAGIRKKKAIVCAAVQSDCGDKK